MTVTPLQVICDTVVKVVYTIAATYGWVKFIEYLHARKDAVFPKRGSE